MSANQPWQIRRPEDGQLHPAIVTKIYGTGFEVKYLDQPMGSSLTENLSLEQFGSRAEKPLDAADENTQAPPAKRHRGGDTSAPSSEAQALQSRVLARHREWTSAMQAWEVHT